MAPDGPARRPDREVSHAPTSPRRATIRRVFPVLVLVGIVLLALNLRGPLVAVSVVTPDLRTDVGMSGPLIGLLTSLPLLCFGLAAPASSGLIARTGLERAVLICLGGLLVGIAVRSGGSAPAALLGTMIVGLAITIGNVVTPVIIGRDFPRHVALITGVYTAAMNVGSMLMLSTTSAVVAAVGWQLALAAPAVTVLIAGAVWLILLRRRTAAVRRTPRAAPPAGGGGRASGMLRRPTTWMLTVAFAGQAFAYYGLTAWLPTLLAEEQGMAREAAGVASSIFQILAIVGAFGTPLIITRLGGPVVAFLVNGVFWLSLPLGLLVAPQWWPLWSVTGGIAQGGMFVAIFTVIVYRSANLRENRQLSAIVQAGGYVIACLGPVVVGALHDSSGDWAASLLVVLVVLVAVTVLGTVAAVGTRR